MRAPALALALLAALLAPPAAAAEEVVLRHGPIDLAGYETASSLTRVADPGRAGYITAMHARLVDARGAPFPAQRVMLHHAVFVNDGRFAGDKAGRDCKSRSGENFYGTAEEDQPLALPAGYGYRVRAGDRWRAGLMVMNHTSARRRVYLEYRMTMSSARRKPVDPYWISVSCRRDKIYDVPGGGLPGSRHARSRVWTAPRGGRVVAAAGHAHGGAYGVRVDDLGCGGRELLSSTARYGGPSDPLLALSPMLHEPSPRSMSTVGSARGWPLAAGDKLRVSSIYDAARPHARVMGIMHLYVARDGARTTRCPPAPGDVRAQRLRFEGAPGLSTPPLVRVQLSSLGADGRARPIERLPGPWRAGDGTVEVRGYAFRPRKLSLALGARVRWRFRDGVRHDITLADGPRAFSSSYSSRGDRFSYRFTTPGEYRLFCSLHPTVMPQVVQVGPPRR